MKFGVIVAARTGSTRLPQKALLPFYGDMPMIRFLLKRIKNASIPEKFILATTSLKEDDVLIKIAESEGFSGFRGSNENLVERYVEAADLYNLEFVVRITGDCPFVDSTSLDYFLKQCQMEEDFDIATTKRLYPIGIDYEVYKTSTMKRLHEKGNMSVDDREHLTKYLYDHSSLFKIKRLAPPREWPKWNGVFTVDEENDYSRGRQIAEQFESVYADIPSILKTTV